MVMSMSLQRVWLAATSCLERFGRVCRIGMVEKASEVREMYSKLGLLDGCGNYVDLSLKGV